MQIMSADLDSFTQERLCKELLTQQPQSKALLDKLLSRAEPRPERGAFAPIRMGFCSACKMKVAAARLQRAKSGEFISCASCARFLYVVAE
jgi:hypothetical protein